MGREHWCHRTFFVFSNLLLRTSIEFNREHKKFPPSLWKFEGFLIFFFLMKAGRDGKTQRAISFPGQGKHEVRISRAEEVGCSEPGGDRIGGRGSKNKGRARTLGRERGGHEGVPGLWEGGGASGTC